MPTKVTKSEFKVMALKDLIPFPNNPNTHPKAQVDAIVRSLDKYGQYYPIIIDENNVILCGHGKKLALEQKGEETAEVKVLYGLKEKDKMRLVAEDNKIQDMSVIDYSALEELLQSIGEHDIIGFSDEYLAALFNENSIDNQGVDLAAPQESVAYRPTGDEEVINRQQGAMNDFENGMSDEAPTEEDMPSRDAFQHHPTANIAAPVASEHRIIICPHCGKEIEI